MAEDWRESAACLGQGELFFAPDGEHHRAETVEQQKLREHDAKRLCGRCPVRLDCLEAALTKPEKEGLWGGLTAEERRAILRRRARRAAA